MSKVGKRLFKVVACFVQILLVVVLVAITIISFAYKLPILSRLGLTFYTVVSGSMEPTIATGSLIYSGKFSLEDLKKGDIITFVHSVDGGGSSIVTHRIDDVKKADIITFTADKKEQKTTKISFVTKGDANGSVDQKEVLPNQVLGKYQWGIPKLGYIAVFTQTQTGFVVLVVLPALILIVWEIFSVVMHFKKKYQKKSEEEVKELKKELEKTKKKVKKVIKKV
ncbi:MAG: Type I signal peptidase [Candidatus Woesebacteria bacterium GW2011_GWB1_43_14]|uniref:Signal peptidase I n=1 Tax=Candidatus Woesebacteria bacterium GW2011_GWB1_43_14 TaxID=1618578 RepID=A0A0G1DHX8_9BACT|nr:MAG: Type I signal peptidase [Candidatus Woesebacteria bacterium GW2011_GWA1_39_11b]KKS77522.1 MAG: Type I signal peptidase [Candidatus Woesebacteria bacterium GW2011_GWC1_42_9]KKS97299.1 MAG: Type I signal peptidase [Candidatus Woesebacteria bacterium GW2011_GWB1_43_14]